jgi:hypothetical protein
MCNGNGNGNEMKCDAGDDVISTCSGGHVATNVGASTLHLLGDTKLLRMRSDELVAHADRWY